MFSRFPSPVRFVPTQPPRQNAPLAFGVCHSALLLSGPARLPAWAALSYRVRVWAFSAIRG